MHTVHNFYTHAHTCSLVPQVLLGRSLGMRLHTYYIPIHTHVHSFKHVHMHTCAHTVGELTLGNSQPSPPPSTSSCKQSEARRSELESLTQTEVRIMCHATCNITCEAVCCSTLCLRQYMCLFHATPNGPMAIIHACKRASNISRSERSGQPSVCLSILDIM